MMMQAAKACTTTWSETAVKESRYNKVLGLAIGERSILAAELAAGAAGGAQPEVRRLAEFPLPAEASLGGSAAAVDPAALGKALGEFLREQKFTARSAVVGLPARWLLFKSKEVPPADSATAADLLRLQAEGEFSSELKDLVFDYAGEASPAAARTVLLVATPRRYVDLVRQVCEAAKVDPVAITSSAAALGVATSRSVGKNAVVLALQPAGAELSAHAGGHTSMLRHLRAPTPEALFLSELRRVVSMLPATSNGSTGGREVVVWDGVGLSNGAIGESLGGMPIRQGDLPALGVRTNDAAASNGAGRKYAAAVALAMAALAGVAASDSLASSVDFLHSRLAEPRKQRVAPWMIWSGAAAVILFALFAFSYIHLEQGQAKLDKLSLDYRAKKPHVDSAELFVKKVAFAQGWHGGDPRFLACLSDITKLFPESGDIYATQVTLSSKDTKIDASKDATAATRAAAEARHIMVTIDGVAPSQKDAIDLYNRFQSKRDRFINLKGPNTSGNQRSQETKFSLSCEYVPVEKTAQGPGATLLVGPTTSSAAAGAAVAATPSPAAVDAALRARAAAERAALDRAANGGGPVPPSATQAAARTTATTTAAAPTPTTNPATQNAAVRAASATTTTTPTTPATE
jgi:hypothetical protein